jgi:AcrR family transcriptional regulator
MSRLTRAETQLRNRTRVLAAARAEFAARGFRDARIDDIAERAELTRGAVYSNFPGKRALYFAVLAEDAERATPPDEATSTSAREALAALARAWVAGLPLATDDGAARLGRDLMPEILADAKTRRPYAQLLELNAIALGLGLERLTAAGSRRATGRRQVRVAEAALTLLHGASQLAAAAPGFTEPFDVVRACEHLADLDLDDRWPVPAIIAPTRPVDEPWTPPSTVDYLRDVPLPAAADGIVAILGLHRLAAAEEAIRAARPGTVTIALVTGEPAELVPLARLALAQLRTQLRVAFPGPAWPAVRLVLDGADALAEAAGVPAVSDATETAIRIQAGRVVARADGFGAGHAIAAAIPAT